jgi:hypothetical protein
MALTALSKHALLNLLTFGGLAEVGRIAMTCSSWRRMIGDEDEAVFGQFLTAGQVARCALSMANPHIFRSYAHVQAHTGLGPKELITKMLLKSWQNARVDSLESLTLVVQV